MNIRIEKANNGFILDWSREETEEEKQKRHSSMSGFPNFHVEPQLDGKEIFMDKEKLIKRVTDLIM